MRSWLFMVPVVLVPACSAGPIGNADDELGDTGSESTSSESSESMTDESSDSESTDASTSTDESTDSTTAGDDECTTHTECTDAHSETWVCGAAGLCMNAITPECPIFIWPNGVPEDNVVILGSILAVSPPFDTLGMPVQNGVALAVSHFNEQAGLPGGEGIALIACDSMGDPEIAKASAEHLVAVGTPAIVGPLFSEELPVVAQDVTIPAGVFLISPTADYIDLADDDLVWHTWPGTSEQGVAIADRLDLVAPPTSLVIVHADDAFNTDLATDVFVNLDPALASVTTLQPFQADVENLLMPIVEGPNPPDTLVILGGLEAETIMLTYLELASQLDPSPPIPRFVVVGPGGVVAMAPTISPGADLLGPAVQMTLYSTLEGIGPKIFDEDNFAEFSDLYFGGQEPALVTAHGYDAAVVSVLAMAAIPVDDPIHGANIATMMARLVDPDGIAIDFGPGFLVQAAEVLSLAATIDLNGVSSHLDFELATGRLQTDLLGYGVVPLGGDLQDPMLDPQRAYVDGVWIDL